MRMLFRIRQSLLPVVVGIFFANSGAWLSAQSNSQSIQTDDSYQVDHLVKNIFAKGACNNITNVQRKGHPRGVGYFENGSNVIGLDRGIILSTGPIQNAKGPNTVANKSGNFGDNSSDPDLSLMTTNPVVDAVGIEFDFVPLDSFVTFRYVFASEEYCEFAGSIFNDVFGFFISGPGISGNFANNAANVALVPGTSSFVAINSINHNTNSGYYIRNELPDDAGQCGPAAPTPHLQKIEYDGFTRPLTAVLRLIPCQTYHIRFVVADVSDNFYDSAVFLEAGSFNLGGRVSLGAQGSASASASVAYEGCSDAKFRFERDEDDNNNFPLTVRFRVAENSQATAGVDYLPLPASVTIPAGQNSATVPIHVLNDNETEGLESLILILDIPCACYTDTTEIYISDPPPFIVDLPDRAVCENTVAIWEPQVSGGIPDYTYLWSTQATTPTISVIGADSVQYSLTVTDACGHSVADTALVYRTQPPLAELSGFAKICDGDTAFLQVNFTGLPPWQLIYKVEGIEQPPISDIMTSPFALPATLGGLYEIVTFSDQGCEGQHSGTASIDLRRIDVQTFADGVSCYGDANGGIAVQVSGATPPYDFFWQHGIPDSTALSNLAAGAYTLYITDAEGCEKAVEIIVPTPDSIGPVLPDCETLAQGQLVLNASGGTPPYQYAVDGGAFGNAGLFQNLAAGEQYDLLIQDAEGCEAEQDFIMPAAYQDMVTLPANLYAQIGQYYPLNPELHIPPSLLQSIRWTPDTHLSCADCLMPELDARENMVYTIRLIDRFGCVGEASIQVHVEGGVRAFIPTGFSPNNDDINERLVIYADTVQVREILHFQVFDRWGGLIYDVRNFPPNDENFGWDGTKLGESMDAGVYTWQALVELTNGVQVRIKGHANLMR